LSYFYNSVIETVIKFIRHVKLITKWITVLLIIIILLFYI